MVPGCPNCSAPLLRPPVCGACGIVLTGPQAQRLWELDQRLSSLDGERAALLTERPALLEALRAGPVGSPAPFAAPVSALEARPLQVQSTLLGLGALLLAVAGIVFAAVSYRSLGHVGQALVLLALTAVAAVAPLRLHARQLQASAEAVAVVALVLAVADVGLLRRAGLGSELDIRTYWAIATAVLAAGACGHRALVPLRCTRYAAVLLAQHPVLLLADSVSGSPSAYALVLTSLAGADLLAAATVLRPHPPRRGSGAGVAVGCAALLLLAATALGAADLADGDRLGALVLLTVAAVLAAASAARSGRVRGVLSAAPVLLVAVAAYGLVRPALESPQRPLVLVAVALLTLQITGLLPRAHRAGPAVGALLVVGAAVATQSGAVLEAVAAPLGWLAEPWSAANGTARQLVGPDMSWTGSAVTLAVLIGAGAAALAAGLVLDRLRAAAAPAAVLLGVAVVVLPLGLGASYPLALGLLSGSASAAVGAAWYRPRRSVELHWFALLVGVLVAAWAVADRGATLGMLPVLAALATVAALHARAAAGVAALLVGAEVAAVSAASGLAVDQVGATLLPVAAAALLVSCRVRRVPLEIAAGVLGLSAGCLAATDPGWLSWTLAADGLLALALAVRPDRRQVAVGGAMLLSASSWVRLWDADVTSPEPYVLPLAALALLLGHLRRRAQPATGSFAGYGPGLTLLLVPSLVASLASDWPLRAVLLLPAAALVVVVGASERLRAPLAIGGAVLAVDGLHLLAPYAAALPRWSLLALVGTVLVVLGATYEQRRQELARAQERFAGLA